MARESLKKIILIILMSSFTGKDSSHVEYDTICLLVYRNERFGAPCCALVQGSTNSLMEYGTVWIGTYVSTFRGVCCLHFQGIQSYT